MCLFPSFNDVKDILEIGGQIGASKMLLEARDILCLRINNRISDMTYGLQEMKSQSIYSLKKMWTIQKKNNKQKRASALVCI